jgi:hypothetical protein
MDILFVFLQIALGLAMVIFAAGGAFLTLRFAYMVGKTYLEAWEYRFKRRGW